MRYVANPVVVEAHRIVTVGARSLISSRPLALDNGEVVVATPEMLARMEPQVGDFWVIQSDGYVYLNPAAVFLHKYHAEAEEPADKTALAMSLHALGKVRHIDVKLQEADLTLSAREFSDRFMRPAAESLLQIVGADSGAANAALPPAVKGNRPPFETFKGPTCKGCFALGNACGRCEKCVWERSQMQGMAG